MSTELWEGRKLTRENVQFLIDNCSTGNLDAHPNIEESVLPLAYSVTATNVSPGFKDLFKRCLPGKDPYNVIGLDESRLL